MRNSSSNENLPMIELSGEQFDRGYQYGKKCKDSMEQFVKFIYGLIDKGKLIKFSSRDKFLSHVSKHIPYIEDYSKGLAKEMEGVAEGAELAYKEIIMLSLLEEIEGGSCTTFAATGKATVNGEVYLGQTWDNIQNVGFPEPLLVFSECDSKFSYMTYTYPGLLAGAGLNSAGIGISWNTVPRLELKVGIPTYLIVAEILRQKTIGEAIGAILRADRGGCFNFAIADKSEIYNVEATPRQVDISYHYSYMGHANHFVSTEFGKKQDEIERKPSAVTCSLIRHNRMNRILSDSNGEIDKSVCFEALRDHVNYPESICRHLDPENFDSWEDFRTEAAWVMIPEDREWWISVGPPCQASFEKYVVG